MKTINLKQLKTALFAAVLTFVLYACQKDKSTNSSDNITEEQASTYSEESVVAEASFEDISDIAMVAGAEEENASIYGEAGRGVKPNFSELREIIGDCGTVTITPDDSTYPKKIVIDFGDGCIGRDGKHRKGAITLYFTAPVRRAGAELTVTFREFYLNRAHIEGKITFTNMNELPKHKWSIKVAGGAVTFPNGRGYKYDAIKVKTQIAGMDTRRCHDDVYTIEGRSNTSFNNGKTITLNTETPLVKKVACPWISEGTLKIKINDRIFMLDYGFPNNGDCDNKALLMWNNGQKQRIIEL